MYLLLDVCMCVFEEDNTLLVNYYSSHLNVKMLYLQWIKYINSFIQSI